MATAILAPVKWNAFPKGHASASKKSASITYASHGNRRLEEEALRMAEETGYFVTVSRELIVSRFVNCALSQFASKREEMIEKALSQIKVMSLCGLHVRELQDIGMCANLRVINLSNNCLAKVEPIISCRHLLKLDLHGNQLSSLPDRDFWNQMKELQILFLHDNPLSGFRGVDRLASCAKLNILTLYDTPLSLRAQYRHHVVNTVWPLRALDFHVISDEEIVDGAKFGGRFTARSLPFQIDPCSSSGVGSDELSSTWQLLRQVNTVLAHHSAVIIIQRHVRGYLVRRALAVVSGTNLWSLTRIKRKHRRVWNVVVPQSATSSIRPPPSTPVVHTERPLTVNASGTELTNLDYDTYMRITRPDSIADLSELVAAAAMPETVAVDLDPSAVGSAQQPSEVMVDQPVVFIDVAKLQSRVQTHEDDLTAAAIRQRHNDAALQSSSAVQHTERGKIRRTKIRTAQDLLNVVIVGQHEDYGEESQSTVAFRLKGFFPPSLSQFVPTVAAAERTRCVESIREMKYSCHPCVTSTVSRQSPCEDDGSRRVSTVGRRSISKGDGGVWLACLNAVSADYRRARQEEESAEKKALVQQRREERKRGLETVNCELERQKSWSNFVEQTERRAISAALDGRAEIERNTTVSYREARRRSTAFQSNRCRDVNFTNEVVKRISACARANERFVESEWRNTKAARASEFVSGWHDDEVARRNDVSRSNVMRRVALQLRVEAEKTQLEATLSNKSLSRISEAKGRVSSLKEARAAASSKPKKILSLPVISTPD